MKILKQMICICLLLTFGMTVAQERKKEMTTATFNYEKDGTLYPYTITTFKKSKSPVKLNPKDQTKLNQKRVETPEYVTKMIYIDDDKEPKYDKYLVMRYIKDDADSFELKPTDRGFMVVVDKHHMEYIIGEGIYFVNSKDRDFFTVDEFTTI